MNKETRFQFGRRAEAYAKSSVLGSQEDLEIAADLALTATTRGRGRVLDVATGTGNLAFVLAEQGGLVTGVDLTWEMLEKARSTLKQKNHLHISFVLGDVEHLPFQDSVFDAVTCRFSLHHFQAPTEAIKELSRVCKNQGRIVLEDIISSENETSSRLQNLIEKTRDPSHIRHYKKSELKEMIENAGLTLLETVERDADFRLEEWLDIADPPREKREQVKKMMSELKKELKLRRQDGDLWFTYQTLILAATTSVSSCSS